MTPWWRRSTAGRPGPRFKAAISSGPYQLRLGDFELAMQDVYDFFYDVNGLLLRRGLRRLDAALRWWSGGSPIHAERTIL
jgi:hypothetical protein